MQPGTYPILDGDTLGTITAGFRVDEEETLGGSRLFYAVSEDLKNGIVTPIHMWRMSSGEMTLDEDGNIALNFTTYNGTSVTATAVYDFSPALTGVENVGIGVGEKTSVGVKKVLRNGRIYILKDGTEYDLLGNQVRWRKGT